MKATNRAASVRARLLNRARADRTDFNLILTRYSLERLLYRLSVSPWTDQFLLKGALLFDLWFDQPHWPTRDIDLLGFGPSELDDLIEVFQQVCVQPSDDGMVFDQGSVQAARIRKEANYEGVRVTLLGTLDGARCSVQIDVGYGDAVTPAAELVQFPALLEDVAPPSLRAYPVYTVIAEKYEAIVSLGMANTRLKDYFDLWFLATYAEIDEAVLPQAIQATFARRRIEVPKAAPLGLSDSFAVSPIKQQQWQAFLSKSKLIAPGLTEVTAELRRLLGLLDSGAAG
ncbi:nucleotidyl transferase AbiEii/AbiGii toxin family protein [Massilia niastensis]|uniref:nucleotidyl transferase AbiEii/AbiGii toxin family protein n=1 Tax=Massilia niastensis TaxID=544911 RepID=UPI000361B399|nr:nucleotidyl transferase AbiEii/AbiGii toxin family protein [Massilia niastensis]